MVKPVEFEGTIYPSKKAFHKYVKRVYHRLPTGKGLNPSIGYMWLVELIKQRHPKAPRKLDDLKNITIQISSFGTRICLLHYNDLKRPAASVSILKACVDGYIKQQHILNKALRYAVKHQVMEFKKAQTKLLCNHCGCANSLQVDHIFPYRSLKDQFIAVCREKKVKVPCKNHEFELRDHVIVEFKDKAFSKEWEDFHSKTARFQLLCKTCNLKKS